MKKLFAIILILLFSISCLNVIPFLAEEILVETENVEVEIGESEEISLDDLIESEPPISEEIEPPISEEIEPVIEANINEYDYYITLDNLYLYNIVALNNATINQHIRGSIYVGNTLTGSQYVDDGAINGVAASDSYIYNNISEIYFKSRTEGQSQNYFFLLTYKSVEETINYWIELIEDLPNGDDNFIYLAPNENGYVDARLWEYNASDEEAHNSIEKIYWTNATSIDVGGIAGHLIAPYADVNIVSSNNCGSIVGWNINTNGEEHINYYTPKRPEPIAKVTPTPTPPTKITITKNIIGNIWHIRCDIMDTTTFEAGGGKWKRDVISNPEGNTSHEGHRSNKCGDADHWVIWVDTEGNSYRMDEVKSGATGGTLPTVIYKPRYDLTTEEVQNMTADDPELVYKYSQNFIDPMPWTEIKIGERVYWTTSNGNQIWYHSGIPYESTPSFMLFIDGIGYPIVAGESIEITDLEPGIHEITEDPSAQYYLGEVTLSGGTVVSTGEWTIELEIGESEQIEIDWPNVVITPIPTNSPTPPPIPDITPTPSPAPTPSPRPTPEIIRPTPQPSIIPPTGDTGFMVPLTIFILAIVGIGIIMILNRRNKK